MAEDEFITMRQAAELLQVSYMTVVRWTRPGKGGEPPRLRAHKLGHRTVRLRRSDVLALVDKAPLPGEVAR